MRKGREGKKKKPSVFQNTNTALLCIESQGKLGSSSNINIVTELRIFVVLGFFQTSLTCPVFFSFAVGVDFPPAVFSVIR